MFYNIFTLICTLANNNALNIDIRVSIVERQIQQFHRLNVHCGSAQAETKYKLVSLAFSTETLQVAPTLNSIIISQHDVLVWK